MGDTVYKITCKSSGAKISTSDIYLAVEFIAQSCGQAVRINMEDGRYVVRSDRFSGRYKFGKFRHFVEWARDIFSDLLGVEIVETPEAKPGTDTYSYTRNELSTALVVYEHILEWVGLYESHDTEDVADMDDDEKRALRYGEKLADLQNAQGVAGLRDWAATAARQIQSTWTRRKADVNDVVVWDHEFVPAMVEAMIDADFFTAIPLDTVVDRLVARIRRKVTSG